MTISRYVVTAIDYIEDGGTVKKLAIVPSESLPKQREAVIRKGRLTRIVELISRLNRRMNEDETS